jgi:transposase InsO family protein
VPWKKVSAVDLREEFVMLAGAEGSNVRALCRRYGISPTTGYKWLGRHAAEGRAGLADRQRRPHGSSGRTVPAMEERIVALRDRHPAWGGRKLRRRLLDLGVAAVPSASTITAVLRRHGRLDAGEAAKHRAVMRFEHAAPNDLWQMDFKGHFALRAGRCHPLTVLDDHSRFALGLEACADERWTTVQARLTELFRRYGLPWRILADNGPPWGTDADSRHTPLTIWLLRLDVAVSHGRPYHPQTQGKAERFHRSLMAELLDRQPLADLDECQRHFDAWRQVYNAERPHQAIGLQVPLARYRPSPRPFPETLPAIEYDDADIVRTVDAEGRISFRNRSFRVTKALRGYRVALRHTTEDGRFDVCFGHHPVASIDLGDAP